MSITESTEGVTEIIARLKGPDAALYWRRLTVMAHGVCPQDPRTLDQRRADAHGAIGAGFFHLACECGTPDCPAAVDDGHGSAVVVHIYTEHAALTAQPDPLTNGEDPQCRALVNAVMKDAAEGSDTSEHGDEAEDGDAPEGSSAQPSAEGSEVADEPDRRAAFLRPPPGVIVGFGHVPAAEIAARIATGATLRHLTPVSYTHLTLPTM